jgi:predicted Rossmann fold nucleotide-binding protein DprA/Smf involved in DNA uptake
VAPIPDLDEPPVVAIVGSRGWLDLQRVCRYVEKIYIKYPGAVIVSGGARGVDQAAEATAHACGLSLISYRPYEYVNMEHKPEFSIETFTGGQRAQSIVVGMKRRISPPFFPSYGQAAFFRNSWIAQDCDVLVAFHLDGSPGTARTIKVAREFGRPVFVYG